MTQNMKQVVLASYARGNPVPGNFRVEEAPIPEPGDREILVKTLWLALDPLIRFSIDEKLLTGIVHTKPGEVMYGPTVAQVVKSHHPDYAVGDIVEGRVGWREYAVVAPDQSDYRGPPRKLDPAVAPVQTSLGALGMPGQTAHACVIGIGRVKAGETVLISAAAGAVGSLAGQIAKVLGATVVGIAGGTDKCAALRELGFDVAVDYKAKDYPEKLKAAVPRGVDCYIDNVGGDVTLAVLPVLNRNARMPVCGYIAYYGVGMEGPGPDHLPGFFRTIMNKGLEVRGFPGSFVGGQQALDDIAGWLRDGTVKAPEAVVDGLENAPAAFSGVFGGNDFVGKLLVKVAEPA